MNAAAGEGGAQVATEPATPGELLRRERERRQLSVQQTAEDLHLDAWTIEALESNRFNALGAPVYARGYLRKYALLLGLSPETVLARYESLSDVPVAPTPIPTSVSAPLRTERISLKRPLLIVAAVLGVALLGWIVQMLMSSPRAPTATIPPPVIEATPPTEARVGTRRAGSGSARRAGSTGRNRSSAEPPASGAGEARGSGRIGAAATDGYGRSAGSFAPRIQ